MIQAAADSRTIKEDLSFNAYHGNRKQSRDERTELARDKRAQTDIKVFLSRGNSSSAISAGKRRKYFPRAIKPKAKVAALTSSPSGEGTASA